MSNSFAGKEFIKALADNSIRHAITVEGMVKPADDGEDAVLLSVGRSCQTWTKIPGNMIDKVDYINDVGCEDHQHPFVRVHLKEAPADNKEAEALTGLLRSKGRAVFADVVSELPHSQGLTARANRRGYCRAWDRVWAYYPCGTNPDGTEMMCATEVWFCSDWH